MTPKDHDRLKYSNVKGYSEKEGLSMFTIEQDPADWPVMSMVWSHMQDSNVLRTILRRSTVQDMTQYDRKEASEVVAYQNEKVLHMRYAFTMSYESMEEIETLEKEVELCYVDGRVASPKFVTLRRLFMNLANPETNAPLIEAVIPIPSRPGRVQLMFRDKGRTRHYINLIQLNPAK